MGRYLFSGLIFSSLMLLIWTDLNQPAQGGSGAWSSWSYSSGLLAVIEGALAGETGLYGVAVKHLASGEEALYDADHQLAAASLYKLAVLYVAYWQRDRGNLSFDEPLAMTPGAATLVDDAEPTIPIGGGILVEDALHRMIVVSDNSAAILLLQRLGPAQVNETMRDLGLTQTEIGVGEMALTSPADVLLLLEKIYRGDEQTLQARQEMVSVLLQQEINDRLPRYLPPETPIAHKTGDLPGTSHDAGIVFAPSGPYLIVVMAEDLPNGERGAETIARLSRAVYDYFAKSS